MAARHTRCSVVKGKTVLVGELRPRVTSLQISAGLDGMNANAIADAPGPVVALFSHRDRRNLLAIFLLRYPVPHLAKMDLHQAAKQVRGLADQDDVARVAFPVRPMPLDFLFY